MRNKIAAVILLVICALLVLTSLKDFMLTCSRLDIWGMAVDGVLFALGAWGCKALWSKLNQPA